MENIVLNETPVRTSKNYGINNIEIKNFEEPIIKEFVNITIADAENCITNKKEDFNLKFGLGEYFTKQIKDESNVNLKVDINKNIKEPIIIKFDLDDKNNVLVDNISVNAKDDTKANIIIIYTSKENITGYHNGICSAEIGKNSNVHITIINLLNTQINNFYTVNLK